jgi:hypothetical protein
MIPTGSFRVRSGAAPATGRRSAKGLDGCRGQLRSQGGEERAQVGLLGGREVEAERVLVVMDDVGDGLRGAVMEKYGARAEGNLRWFGSSLGPADSAVATSPMSSEAEQAATLARTLRTTATRI